MKKIALGVFMISALLSCKKNTAESECEKNTICTTEFRSVSIRFVDNRGEGAEVKDFNVVNQRNGEKLHANSSALINMIKGTYLVADDGNTKSLSEEGDDLKITATSVETNQTKSAIVKVKGGKCACHISKVSGPEQVVFD